MLPAEASRRLRLWSTHPLFDADTRRAAAALAADENEALRCFGQELSFGTGGLRGELGVGSNRMNRYTVARATAGLAAHLQQNGGGDVAIAYDSRLGSSAFAAVAAGVLAARGLRAHLFPRLMPTPLLSYAVRALGCAAGIVVTASHNPSVYNGYKVYGPDGGQITDEAAAAITACIQAERYETLRWLAPDEARRQGLLADIPEAVPDAYLRGVLALRPADTPAASLRVAYTPLHGTGLEPVTRALQTMGVGALELVQAQCVPDGHFPTAPFPNPELPQALALGLALARETNADVLLATDPDCDRVGVAVPDETGAWQTLTGNEVGLLLLEDRLAQGRAERPVAVKTIVTSDLAFSIAAAHGAELHEVLTGFKYIGEAIGRLEAAGEAGRFVFGFEESCGYLAGTQVRDKDGVVACVLLADLAYRLQQQGKTLWQARNALYARYGVLRHRLVNVDIRDALPMATMRRLLAALRAHPPQTLAGQAVAAVKDYLPGLDGLPPADVLAFSTREGCKAIVRPSGTEPKVKVYLSAKAEGHAAAEALLGRMEADAHLWLQV